MGRIRAFDRVKFGPMKRYFQNSNWLPLSLVDLRCCPLQLPSAEVNLLKHRLYPIRCLSRNHPNLKSCLHSRRSVILIHKPSGMLRSVRSANVGQHSPSGGWPCVANTSLSCHQTPPYPDKMLWWHLFDGSTGSRPSCWHFSWKCPWYYHA